MTRRQDPTDEDLALAFLAGLMEERAGVVSHRYLEKSSETEVLAQAALVRLLRGDRPLTKIIRWRLAGLFDPHSTDDRQLKFVNRRRGPKKMTATLSLEIARYIAEEYRRHGSVPGSIEAALGAARDRYAVSMRTVARAWAENKDRPLIRGLLHGNHTIN